MEQAKENQENNTFKEDVIEGLTRFPKRLLSKYFYDKKGDEIFQQIMSMPEYYLTDCEMEILSTQTADISRLFESDYTPFELIELGAGDGKKTKVLLKYMLEKQVDFVYKPIDISHNILEILEKDLNQKLPTLRVKTEIGEYFGVLERLKNYTQRRKVILMLGSNIGNLLHPQAISFLNKLKNTMNDEDILLMGFDQKKSPDKILAAYNDSTKITEAFNFNILERINRELGADFDVKKFMHWPSYNPESGTTKSFLVAKEEMYVYLKDADLTIHFDRWETIHTEISQKYTDDVIQWLANEAGLEIVTSFTDKKAYYKDYVFQKRN
ncbi:MAG: L-histidine N(alpha)-methyltransferase [Chitinophagales bacterium]|nr:L-histidine N(alpha)-methyltransferase [Chitinophagales bacterium]